MLTLRAPRAETLWDELLPVVARELPEDLARIDELLGARSCCGRSPRTGGGRPRRRGGRC
jgi:hypothetical protein